MKALMFSVCRPAAVVRAAALAGCLVLGGPRSHSQDSASISTNAAADKMPDDPEADKAWKDAFKASQAPAPPVEWREKRPTQEEVAKFYAPLMVKAADTLKDFYTRFPNHPKAAEARKKEYALLAQAVSTFGESAQSARLAALDQERLSDPKLSEDDRFGLRMASLKRLLGRLPESEPEAEQSARALQKDFPKRSEPSQVLLMIAANSAPEKLLALAREIAEGNGPDEIKAAAKGLLKKNEALGKPLDIKFTALDGRKADLAELKGKVVLIDFWATWCPPCVGEMPHVKEAYTKLHEQGFEILGISFDQEKDALEKFVRREKMPWPQYFDGKGWENKFGLEYGIQGIPAMWLVDKQGNLRDMEALDGLEGRVVKLLAE